MHLRGALHHSGYPQRHDRALLKITATFPSPPALMLSCLCSPCSGGPVPYFNPATNSNPNRPRPIPYLNDLATENQLQASSATNPAISNIRFGGSHFKGHRRGSWNPDIHNRSHHRRQAGLDRRRKQWELQSRSRSTLSGLEVAKKPTQNAGDYKGHEARKELVRGPAVGEDGVADIAPHGGQRQRGFFGINSSKSSRLVCPLFAYPKLLLRPIQRTVLTSASANARAIYGATRHLDTISFAHTSSRKIGVAIVEHNPTGRSYIHCSSAKETSRLAAFEHLLVITEDILQRMLDTEGISSSG
ncbi:hypothetical protein BU24DRAFT_406086 [Aaosphaeria arxii CBS 175.79]|uniref:Uncharacterized protein n=1 Tax=Aaosphaeria arxii CBS 175.79 TaxID=1450172 RepID=A0A6A5Y2Z7_9PLEO|nr:uncharacterized protein BU24DRAFT_406086 [Aaosphaeria arxii CBS 175.79]KAF2019417.1 hypothetical protein BU24DRAFT_406086 [Aaosphaeria arxii CBS 175.79]